MFRFVSAVPRTEKRISRWYGCWRYVHWVLFSHILLHFQQLFLSLADQVKTVFVSLGVITSTMWEALRLSAFHSTDGLHETMADLFHICPMYLQWKSIGECLVTNGTIALDQHSRWNRDQSLVTQRSAMMCSLDFRPVASKLAVMTIIGELIQVT